jgi:hypothetical protein
MSYFSRLSLPYNSLDLPLTYYIDKLVVIIPILIVINFLAYHFCRYLHNKCNCVKNIKKVKYIIEKVEVKYFLIILFLFIQMFLVPHLFGEMIAQQFLKGNASNSFQATLEFKNESYLNLSNKVFLLVIYNDNKYYVTEKDINASKCPILYIISSDEIKYANITRLNTGYFDMTYQIVKDLNVEIHNLVKPISS